MVAALCALACGLTQAQPVGNPFGLFYDGPRRFEGEFHYDQEPRVRPEPSDFVIEDYTLLSNEFGERWALVTFRNTSNAHRVLKNEHLVATLASGQRVYAANLDIRLDGQQRYTQAVFFGVHKFPIFALETAD